ncbi:N-acetylneuraminate synthase family protein [Candidatus Pelagibacter sp. HIMB1748]|uniref:N-acetylneuraminate synthase family protein n=1 Tax=unclassified Candidatus Pelagibacter TaxID=2647897 RepID=UPI003F851B0B
MKKKYKIIAELGSVHDGNLNLAKKLIKKASESGADIVKFQMHIAEEETLEDAPSPDYFKTETRFNYFKRTAFNFKEWIELKKICKYHKVKFLCSPFSEKAVDILERIKVDSYKVPSGELTNLPLLEKLKKTNKHIYLSTGMSDWREITVATKLLKKNYTLLQCSSIYPCPLEQVGLNVLFEMQRKYDCDVGFSDHTLGFSAPFAAAANGASVIEKHFTLSRNMYGSDAKNSMEPKEFSFLSKTIKEIWKIVKNPVNKNNIKKYKKMKIIFEKGIVASYDLSKNTVLTKKNINFKKPADGIRAFDYKKILGKKLKRNIKANHKIKLKDLK